MIGNAGSIAPARHAGKGIFTVAAFSDYGAPSVSVASHRQPPSAVADYCQHYGTNVTHSHAQSRTVTHSHASVTPQSRLSHASVTPGDSARADIRQGRALKSCKRCFIALRSCPATQHFTHGQKYFEKMLARFQVRA